MDYFIIFVMYNATKMVKIKSGFRGERAIVLPASVVNEFRNESLGRLLYITDIGFYPNADYHYRSRSANEVCQYILLYCIDGEGWIEINGIKQKLTGGEVVILLKNKSHSYGSSPENPWTIYWIHFDGILADYFSCDMEKPVKINVEKDSRISERLELFEDIFKILKNGYSFHNLNYSVTVFFHFLGTLKFLSAFRRSQSDRQSTRDTVDEAIHFMRENIQKQLKLKDVAEYLGLSESHFSLLFRKKTGYAPLSYFNQLRIQAACHHLDFSELQINQIAGMTGFNDPFYFSRVFSKTMGCAPKEYRKRKKG